MNIKTPAFSQRESPHPLDPAQPDEIGVHDRPRECEHRRPGPGCLQRQRLQPGRRGPRDLSRLPGQLPLLSGTAPAFNTLWHSYIPDTVSILLW